MNYLTGLVELVFPGNAAFNKIVSEALIKAQAFEDAKAEMEAAAKRNSSIFNMFG